ncbi:MAG: DEAD/DEAH box helicase [Fibrobacterales bacterium]
MISEPVSLIEPENPLPDHTIAMLSEPTQQSLIEQKWDDLFPVQKKAIPYMLAGRDMLIQSQTGSGKTGAFVIPLVELIVTDHNFPQALIMVPTRELAVQVEVEVQRIGKGRGVKSVCIYGGVPYDKQVKLLKEGAHIVVATPGRLLDLLEKKVFDFLSLRDLIMDEADEMLSMGFYPDMRKLKSYFPKQRCTTLFSATIPNGVKYLAKEFQSPNADFLCLSYEKMSTDFLEHDYYIVPQLDKDNFVIKLLEYENPESCIVFCNQKKDVHYLEQYLDSYGFTIGALSSDVTQNNRQKILKQFRSQELKVLIATDVAARGIDISHVSHVIIHDHPDNNEVYIHRSGRTARAGNTGKSISLVTQLEELELLKTEKQFGLNFIKKDIAVLEELEGRVRERVRNFLASEKRSIRQSQKKRLGRYLPLIEEMLQNEDEKEVLAYLLDTFYWKRVNNKD